MKTKEENGTVATEYRCPVCGHPLFRQWGDQLHPNNKDFGVVLFCAKGDPNARNHPQEVSGHGNGRSEEAMIKNAFSVIEAKFCGAKYESDLPEPEAEETAPAPAPVVEDQPKKGKRKTRQTPPVVEPDEENAI